MHKKIEEFSELTEDGLSKPNLDPAIIYLPKEKNRSNLQVFVGFERTPNPKMPLSTIYRCLKTIYVFGFSLSNH